MFGRVTVTGLAEQVFKAFSTSDLAHVKSLLGVKGRGGFTEDMAYKLAKHYPEVAKLIVARAKK